MHFMGSIIDALQKPLTDVGQKMTMTHPIDSIDILIKTSLFGGAILASPFILYQLWLFISPGHVRQREEIRLALHVDHGGPFPLGRMVRLSLGDAGSDEGPDPATMASTTTT